MKPRPSDYLAASFRKGPLYLQKRRQKELVAAAKFREWFTANHPNMVHLVDNLKTSENQGQEF